MLTTTYSPDELRRDGDAASPGATAPLWQPLRFLNLYRLVIATILVLMGFSQHAVTSLGGHYPRLYFAVSLSYVAFAVLSIFTIDWRSLSFRLQTALHVLADIAAITLLIHASGGLRSGLGVLLVVAIAGGSLLMAGRTAIMFAAIATLSVLAEQGLTMISDPMANVNFTHAGLLGAALFITATLTCMLARRVRETEALAAQRGLDLANLEQLTRYIVERMQTGIVVVDGADRIRLINDSARHLLGLEGGKGPAKALPAAVLGQLKEWRDDAGYEPYNVQPTRTGPDILPRFARLGVDKGSGTLVFVEDMTAMAQQAQQLKLASLGRLTASIAHEIRNPLGAISHAGQLLAELPHEDAGAGRLTRIICDQSQRVNTIVDNVLQLSRGKRSQPREIGLKSWLAGFVTEFCRTEQIGTAEIYLTVDPAELAVRFDPDQLHQILWNLCHNGLRYTRRLPGLPLLELRGGLESVSQMPILEVVDFGPGIGGEAAEHIFEPFYTTAQKGTGLGLYIARELCEANQARLNYLDAPSGGSCFRISFADPRRKQVV